MSRLAALLLTITFGGATLSTWALHAQSGEATPFPLAAQLNSVSPYPEWLPFAKFGGGDLNSALGYWADMIVTFDEDDSSNWMFFPFLRTWITGDIVFHGLTVDPFNREYSEPVARVISLSELHLRKMAEFDLAGAAEALDRMAACTALRTCSEADIDSFVGSIVDGTLYQLLCARIMVDLGQAGQSGYYTSRLGALSLLYLAYDLEGGPDIDALAESGLVPILELDGGNISPSDSRILELSHGAGELREFVFFPRFWDGGGYFTFGNAPSICAVLDRRAGPVSRMKYYSIGAIVLREDGDADGGKDSGYAVHSIDLRALPLDCD